jgi:hypothetical protein
MRSYSSYCAAIVACMLCAVRSAPADEDVLDARSIRLFGSGSYQFGQIVKGRGIQQVRKEHEKTLDHTWNQQAIAQIGVNAEIAPKFDLTVGMECALVFSYLSSSNVLWKSTLYPAYLFYPSQIQGSYAIGYSL